MRYIFCVIFIPVLIQASAKDERRQTSLLDTVSKQFKKVALTAPTDAVAVGWYAQHPQENGRYYFFVRYDPRQGMTEEEHKKLVGRIAAGWLAVMPEIQRAPVVQEQKEARAVIEHEQSMLAKICGVLTHWWNNSQEPRFSYLG